MKYPKQQNGAAGISGESPKFRAGIQLALDRVENDCRISRNGEENRIA